MTKHYYSTIEDLRDYLTQLPANERVDQKLEKLLVRTTSIVDKRLGFSFTGYTEAEKRLSTVFGPRLYLPMTYEAGSISQVTVPNRDWCSFHKETMYETYYQTCVYPFIPPKMVEDEDPPPPPDPLPDFMDVPDWFEEEPIQGYSQGHLFLDKWRGWRQIGRHIYVTANWGYGDPPFSIEEVVLELTVNIHQSANAGIGRFTNVIGVQGSGGSAVGYEGAMTPLQRQIINDVKLAYTPKENVFYEF